MKVLTLSSMDGQTESRLVGRADSTYVDHISSMSTGDNFSLDEGHMEPANDQLCAVT